MTAADARAQNFQEAGKGLDRPARSTRPVPGEPQNRKHTNTIHT